MQAESLCSSSTSRGHAAKLFSSVKRSIQRNIMTQRCQQPVFIDLSPDGSATTKGITEAGLLAEAPDRSALSTWQRNREQSNLSQVGTRTDRHVLRPLKKHHLEHGGNRNTIVEHACEVLDLKINCPKTGSSLESVENSIDQSTEMPEGQ